MSFSFDNTFLANNFSWDASLGGQQTPPLTPVYPTPSYFPKLPADLLDLPPLQLPFLDPLRYTTPPTTPPLTPLYDLLPPGHAISSSDYFSNGLFPPTSSAFNAIPPGNRVSAAIPEPLPPYSPPQLPYTPVLETARSSTQRFSPYQRPRKISPAMKRPSPRASASALSVTPPTPTTPSLLEQALSATPPPPSLLEQALSGTPPAPTTPSLLEQAASPIMKTSPSPVLKPLGKKRKPRTELTEHQKTQLEVVFKVYKYLGHDVREKVAAEVGLPEKTVLYWFQNRRAREKKAEKKSKKNPQ